MGAPSPMGPPPMPPQDGGYPSGTDAMAQQPGGEQIENPVIAGFRSIIMLISELEKNQDPRAAAAKEHLAGLLQTLQGAPMAPPTAAPEPAMGPEVGAGAPMGPEAAPPPVMAPPMEPAPAPMPEMETVPGEQASPPSGVSPMGPQAGAKGKARPMHKQPNPQGKQPVVLT